MKEAHLPLCYSHYQEVLQRIWVEQTPLSAEVSGLISRLISSVPRSRVKETCPSECVSGFYLLSFARCYSIWEACGHGPRAVTGCPGQHSVSAFHKPDPWQSFPVALMVTGTISFLVHLVWLGWASQIPNTKLHTHKENQADFQGYLSLLQLGVSCFALFWFLIDVGSHT